MSFREKVIAVTGAAAGIGAATATLLAERGASSLALCDVNLDGLEKVAQSCTFKLHNDNSPEKFTDISGRQAETWGLQCLLIKSTSESTHKSTLGSRTQLRNLAGLMQRPMWQVF